MPSSLPGTLRVLIPASRIRKRVRELARSISRDFQGQEITLLCVLKGSFVFLADLVRELPGLVHIDFLAVSSYGSGVRPSGPIRLVKDVASSLRGRKVLVVEDVVDTGRTVAFLRRHLARKGARAVRICALLDKPSVRSVPISLDYVGFRIPDRFVVGYGLDVAERYRNLPYLAVFHRKNSAKADRPN